MIVLIAQGKKPGDRWRRPLPEDQPFVVGRTAAPWSIPWDTFISREHARLVWRSGTLEVERLPSGRNPVFWQGVENARFQLKPGDSFVIGHTTFTVAEDSSPAAASATQLFRARTFNSQELKKVEVRDAAHHLDVLSRLPEVIAGAANATELYVGLVNLLLAGIARADAAALVSLDPNAEDSVRVLHWDRRRETEGSFRPSTRLIQKAIDQRGTEMHIWIAGSKGDSFTVTEGFDWAFCTPVSGEFGKGLGIYVAGALPTGAAKTLFDEWDTNGLVDDLKFTELLGAIWSSLQQVKSLQQREVSLGQFFSRPVLASLTNADPDLVLKPRQADVSVLFCDLRGFSKEAEKHADDLLAMLERVSKALGLMTQNILDQGGVIGDFQGDASMGFWGWPLPQPDTARRACLAALGIRSVFEAVSRKKDHPLAGFRVGVGVATGQAVAGKIGSVDQVKVTVFGPVVNLASRLEGMTKILRVPILVDEATAKAIKAQVPPDVARIRRLALVQPYGLATPLTVSELMPPVTDYPLLTDVHLADYDRGLEAFIAGRWSEAYELLRKLPPEDRGPDLLTTFILQNNHTPPPNWNGIIPMSSKS